MKKRFLSLILAMVMIMSGIMNVAAAEVLSSTAWWSGTGGGSAYTLADNSTVTFNIDVNSTADVNGYCAFTVEVRDNGDGVHCITSSSDGNCYYFTDGGTTGDAITGVANPLGSNVKVGEKYKVSVTRSGATYTIVYYNVSTGEEVFKFVCANTNMTATSTVDFVAQVGNYDVTVEGSTETLTSTAWWSGTGNGGAYPLADNSTAKFKINVDGTTDVNGYCAFTVEVRDNGDGVHCITSSSDGNCYYYADGGTTGDAVTGVANPLGSNVRVNEEYEVAVTRSGSTYTIVYYNVLTDTEVYRFVCANTNMTADSTIDFVSQVGTYTVEYIDTVELIDTIGAQTQANDHSVLGFVTLVSKAEFDANKEDIAEMGIIVKNSANATNEALTIENVTTDGAIRKIVTEYVTDVTTLDSTKSDELTYAFRSVITGISDEAKTYTAVPYIKYADGNVVYGEEITRSVAQVK